MHLLDLPTEILAQIPHHLSTIWDYYSLLRTCRHFHQISQTTTGDASLHLSKSGGRPDGNPQSVPHFFLLPHLLLAGVARPLADWAIESPSNRITLSTALRDGCLDVFELACSVIRLRLSCLQALQTQKANLLDPLSRLLETTCGISGQAARLGVSVEECLLAMDDGVFPQSDICTSPVRALLNYWIYTELFYHDLERLLAGRERAKAMPSLGSGMRRLFWRYCVPGVDDWARRNEEWAKWMEPFQVWDQWVMWDGDVFRERRKALERLWETGEVVEEGKGRRRFERRRKAFLIAAVNDSAVSLRTLLPGGMEEARGRLKEIRERVRGLEEQDVWIGDENEPDEEAEEKDESEYWGGMFRDLELLAPAC